MKYALSMILSGFVFFACMAHHGKDATNTDNFPQKSNLNLNKKNNYQQNEHKNWFKCFQGNAL